MKLREVSLKKSHRENFRIYGYNLVCIKKQKRLKLMEDKEINKTGMNHLNIQSKKRRQRSVIIQSSTTPTPGHHKRK